MTKRLKSFAVPIFGARVHYTNKVSQARKWLDKHGFDYPIKGMDGFTEYDSGDILIYANKLKGGLLAHEAVHAAYYVLTYSGIESRDEELVAHLTQYITDKVIG